MTQSIPSAARPLLVQANGLRLRGWQQGDQGRPVLLLHGYTSASWHTWRHVAPQLATRFRTYWFDLRGHGDSDTPLTGYTIADFAADAQALCATLDLDRPLLVGHSLGGMASLHLAAEAPTLPAGIVPLDPRLTLPGGQPAQRNRFFDILDTKHLPPLALVAALRAQWPHIDDDELAYLVQARAQVSITTLVEYWRALTGVDMLAPLAGQVTRGFDLRERFGAITCPVLLVRGSQLTGNPVPSVLPDDLFADALRRLPHGQGVTIEGAGHDIPMEQPNALVRAITTFADRLPDAG